MGDLLPVGADGEIKDGGVTEEAAKNQLETYGKKFCLTRKMIINDDLGAFMKVPVAMGNRAARLIDQLFFSRLLKNPVQLDGKALFSAAHKNLLTGATSALSSDSLKKAIQMFLDQVDADGQPISVEPKFLLVPTALKHLAIELTRGATLITAGGADNVVRPALNILADENLQVVSSPYLANAAYDGASSTAWYLFGDPRQVDTWEIGYLKGKRTPTVERGETDFNTLGLWFRVYFDLGVREQEHRGMVKSAGAVYQIAVTSTFASNTASGTSTTPLVTSKITRLYPLSNALRAQETTVDARGNSATTSESYNPTSRTHTFVRSYPGISNLESAVQRDGLLLSSVSILGGTTSFAYDGLHRQVAQTDPRGNVTSQVYNSYGQVASVIEPTGAVTTYGYDNMGRMTRVVNALGGTVSYTYNQRGQKLSESGNATYPVEYEYDDDTGKLSAHCLHRNSNTDDRTYYYYDSCTQLLKEKCDANGSSVRYEYDSNGLLAKRTWARTTSNGADLITSYTYNVFGELTSVSYNDTTPNVSFTRDALGREVGRSDGAGSHTTAYNAYGEVTSERFPLATNSSAVISRTYDSLGRPKTILLGGVTAASYAYDAATGRYATVKNNSATVTYSYLDKTNLPSVQTWQKGTSSAFLTVSNTYDAYNRLTLINANSSNQAAYVYDSLGRRTSATLQDDTAWNYSYNQRSEITSAIRKNASNVTQNNMRYVFDNIGNRTSSYENPTSKTYSANSLNQYTGINVVGSSSISPQYDDDGNTTEYGSWTYTWDAENRLVKAVNGTTRLEFIYDALSRRVAKKFFQGNTLSKHERYVYDGMKLLASYNAKSSFAKINTFLWQPFGADVPLIMTCGSTIYGYLVDANKNVLGLFNPSQSRVATYLYGPFGQIISSSGTIAANNPIRFSSEQFDADLGLVYYNYRYYSPELGRWLSKDPIGEEGGLNLYLMCGNSVVNVWDKWGFILYAIDGTLHSKEKEEEDKSIVQRFCELSIETAKYWGGPIFPITGLDASFIFREVKDEICSDYCADNSLKINIIGWSRGATIAMEIAEYLEDNGCCCNGKKVYPRINWLGLLDAVDMTVTWGWAHDITSNVDNATHLKKTESQLIFPTSSGNAENPQKTKLTEAYLFESTHGDVGGPTKKRNKKRNQAGLHWMVHQAQKSGVKMKDVPVNYIVIKEN